MFKTSFSFAWSLVAGVCFLHLGFCTAQAQNPPLALRKGLTAVFAVYGARAQTGEYLGDYETTQRVADLYFDGGYRMEFRFSPNLVNPNETLGFQVVAGADKKNSKMNYLFRGPGDMTRPGFGTLLAISDASFAALKAGKDVPYETAFSDGRLGTDQNPITIKKEGEEELTIIVNERATKIRTIKATGAAGGTFWIIDNPALPMVAKYQWNYNFIVTSITDASLGGVKIIDDLKKSGVAVSHSILFDFNSANIDRAGRPVLDSVADYLKSNPKIKLEVQGHTDIIGGADYNLHLSQRRAEAVCADLRAAGISADRLVAKGFGLTMPIADNAIPEGRAQNRRVVFRVL